MTLTLDGLRFIADHNPDLLPDLSDSAIKDKGKANTFTKMITIAQALWSGIQCVTRSTQGLSISFLEINTAIHAACALALYFFFWWDKPLDVEEPTICTHVDLHHIAAFMVAWELYPGVKLSLVDLQNTEDNDMLDCSGDSGTVVSHPKVRHILLRPSKNPEFQSKHYFAYHGFVFHKNTSLAVGGVWYDQLTELDFDRFKLASKPFSRHGLQLREGFPFLGVRSKNHFENMFAVEKVNGWRPESKHLVVGFFLAGFFYGGVHLVVWNRPFRGEIDKLFWKWSSITLLVSGIPAVIWYLAGVFHDLDPSCWTLTKRTFLYSSATCFYLFMPLYIFARIFIVVECFLDVFHLPDSAFEVPRWSQYFPHIG